MSFRYPKGGFIQLFFDPLTPGTDTFSYPAYTWGANAQGQLGQNNVALRSSPTQLGSLGTWQSASGGNQFYVSVKTNGTLWAWGQNADGQLGQNDVALRSSPVQIGALTNWSITSVGNSFVLAIKTDGTLWGWGVNQSGQLGQNDTSSRSSPVQIGSLTTWSKVGCGVENSFVIKTDGTLWSWGSNNAGQLPAGGTVGNRSSPVQVGALTDWSGVSAGSRFALAYKTDGTAWTWGDNQFGQCGQNSLTIVEYSSPTQIGALTTWSKVSAMTEASSMLKNDGTIWVFGRNNQGQLGQNDIVYRSSPVQVGALTTWSKISAGGTAMFSIKTDQTLWAWGNNGNGRLGDDSIVNRSSPVQIGALTTWDFISESRGAISFGILKSPN